MGLLTKYSAGSYMNAIENIIGVTNINDDANFVNIKKLNLVV